MEKTVSDNINMARGEIQVVNDKYKTLFDVLNEKKADIKNNLVICFKKLVKEAKLFTSNEFWLFIAVSGYCFLVYIYHVVWEVA